MARLGRSTRRGTSKEALERLEAAFATVAEDEPDADVAELAARLGAAAVFAGDLDRAREPNDLALRVAQELRLPSTLCRGLLAKGIAATGAGRPEEALALMRHALRHAPRTTCPISWCWRPGTSQNLCFALDRYGEALEVPPGSARARSPRRHCAATNCSALSELSYVLTMLGRWDEALAAYAEIPEEAHTLGNLQPVERRARDSSPPGAAGRGRGDTCALDGAERTSEVQTRACIAGARSALLFNTGRHAEALEAGVDAAGLSGQLGYGQQGVKEGLVWAVEAALVLGDQERADEMLGDDRGAPARAPAAVPGGAGPPIPRAHEL